ncbi:MAG: hypothetical protein KJ063_05065 [Anaerolineae bacterium]|nr:hypothetical protein [Anaerolineae bacterium]
MDIVYSINQVPIRVTSERWWHIVENHDDMAGHYEDVLDVLEDPDLILSGHNGSRIAIKNYGRNRYLAIIYRELSQDDGFVISAYFTSKVDRKKAIWRK